MPSGSTDFLPKAAEAAHLTAALRRAGVLGQESVRDVTIESARVLLVSRITRLCLSYDGAAPDAPRSGPAMEAFLQDVARRYAQFVERFGDHLPPERRALFEPLRAVPWFFVVSVLNACGRTIRTDLGPAPGDGLPQMRLPCGAELRTERLGRLTDQKSATEHPPPLARSRSQNTVAWETPSNPPVRTRQKTWPPRSILLMAGWWPPSRAGHRRTMRSHSARAACHALPPSRRQPAVRRP